MPSRSRLVQLALALGVWILLRLSLVVSGGEIGRGVTVRIDHHDVAMVVFRGEVPARTLIVASHGGLASKETLLPICWEARYRGADCVVVDALGHGASGELPEEDVVGAMRRALRVDGVLGPYADVRYVGHSMGAYLGSGTLYPCERSVSIGQRVPCDARRIVWGDVHRALGLPDVFYAPVSHLLEPWTPSVVREAVSRLLPKTPRAQSLTITRIALAWGSLGAMMIFGVLLAKQVRASGLAPALRGAVGAAVLWCALMIGAWRTVWFLIPTQKSDAAMIAGVVLVSVAPASALRALGVRAPLVGVALAALVSEGAAMVAWRSVHLPLIASLLILLPLLDIPLILAVTAWERLSRGMRGSDPLESATFCSVLLGTFLALLLPGR